MDKVNMKRGWVISNNEHDEIVIQKYDESDRFNTDEEAVKFVVNSYNKILQALCGLLGCCEADNMDDKSNVYRSAMLMANNAIDEAEK